jgi:hypothetical protein
VSIAEAPVDIRTLLVTASLVIASFVAITFVGAILVHDGDGRLIAFLFSLVVPPLIALFGGFLMRKEWRDAISASLVVAYLLLLMSALGLKAFGNQAADTQTFSGTLLPNFTALMGIIIAFYFGSEASIQIGKQVLASRVASANSAAAASTPAATK